MRNLLVLAFLAVAAVAQEQPKPAPAEIQKLVTLRYADPNTVSALLRGYRANIRYPGSGRIIALSGSPEAVAVIEQAIKQLDVEPKNVEMTVYFVVGTEQSNTQAGNPIPEDIQNVVAQLKKTFAFKNYSLLDALTLRTRSGVAADTSGVISSPGSTPRLTQFRVRAANVSDDGASIRIDGLRAGLRNPVAGKDGTNYVDTGLNTDIDVKEGQKVVIGRSSLAGPDTALFLVLSARVTTN